MAGRWFSSGTPVSSTNKTDRHDITEILLKVSLNTIPPTLPNRNNMITCTNVLVPFQAERKSVNKYYPPDWDPSKGSVNKYVGQHPLRDRAKKLSQGILVIRFVSIIFKIFILIINKSTI
jgi:hypothetical protein